MEFDRKVFIKKLDNILGLIKTLKVAYEEELESISIEDIKELANLLEEKLIDAKNYVETN